MPEDFRVACENLRAAAKAIQTNGDTLRQLGGRIGNLKLSANAFPTIKPMAWVAASYVRLEADMERTLTDVGAPHLYDVSDALQEVANHYEDQDAENAKPFHYE